MRRRRGSTLDDATHPWLPHLAELMAETSARGTAVLGICLGAQLFARGLGGQNLLGRTPEFGWVEIERKGEDPVLDAVPGRFPIFQWHSDTFTAMGCNSISRPTAPWCATGTGNSPT